MKRGRSQDGRDEKNGKNPETSPSRDKAQYLYRLFALHPSVSRNIRHLTEPGTSRSQTGGPESVSDAGEGSSRTSGPTSAITQTAAPSSFGSVGAGPTISTLNTSHLNEGFSRMPGELTALVTAATGHQGSAVVRSLLTSSTPNLKIHVRCLVRNFSSPAAQTLQASGAHLYLGDFTSVSVLRRAMQGCDAVFLNTQPGAEDEEQQARNVLGAASDAGVRHVLASTTTRAGEHSSFKVFRESPTHPMLEFFRSKAAVQDAVREWGSEGSRSGTDRSYTILQPSWIMTNFLAPVAEPFWDGRVATEGVLRTAFPRDTRVPLVSGRDVGRFASQAFLDVARGGDQRQKWNGKVVPLAGDQLTMEEIAAVMGDVGGRKLEVEYMADLEVKEKRDADPYVFFQWWETVDGSGVDLDEVHKFGLQTTTFREFLEENRDRLRETLGVRG